jgi:hypothetical protein
MKRPVFFMLAALLLSPAWSEEPAATTTAAPAPATSAAAVTPRSFDPGSDSIRKIVRNTAATQDATVEPVERAVEPKPWSVADIKFVKPEKTTPAERPAPLQKPASSPANTFVSALVGIALDEVVDGTDGFPPDGEPNAGLACKPSDDDACPFSMYGRVSPNKP